MGMSQERLGEALGLTFQQVQKYERGVNRVGASRLFDLSRVLDVSISFFFDDMPEPLTAMHGTHQTSRAVGGFAEAQDGFGAAPGRVLSPLPRVPEPQRPVPRMGQGNWGHAPCAAGRAAARWSGPSWSARAALRRR